MQTAALLALSLTLSDLPPAVPPSPHGSGEVPVSTAGGGLTVRAGAAQLQLGGRLQVVAATLARGMPNGTDVRRARLHVKGTIDPRWKFKLEYDFRDQELKDAFVTWTGAPAVGNVSFGQVFPPVSLENYTSSRWITFIERSLPNALTPDRELGLAWDKGLGDVLLQASLTFDNIHADDTGGDTPTALARAVWAPRHEGGEVLHFGASLAQAQADDGRTVAFGARPEAQVDGNRKPIQVAVPGADGHWLGGLEALWQHGATSVQAEALAARVDAADDPTFWGAYVYLSRMFGGQRSYDFASGACERSATRDHAWELALRWSILDLDDRGHAGGVARDATLGVNYYPSRNVRFAANAIHAAIDGGGAGDEEIVVGLLLAQLTF